MRELSVTAVGDKLRGVTVLLRTSLNVPVDAGVVRNPFRLHAALPTIQYLSSHGARVVLISHIDGGVGASLLPVYEYLKKHIALKFSHDVAGTVAQSDVRALKNGEVLLLENVRRDQGEVANDPQFARKLAVLGDVFVNDDFAAAHRVHASVVGLPTLMPSYAGLQFIAERDGLARALTPKSPSLAIVGGAKFITKEPLIRVLLAKYDYIFVGGALAADFLKAKGYEVGTSLVSDSPHLKDLLTNSKILLPIDAVVENAHGREVKKIDEVLANDNIQDVGPATIASLEEKIMKAKIVLWNGPMGNFEKGYSAQTEALATLVASGGGDSIVGGGDTIASIEKLGLNSKFEFLSTAGGAMLDFLANGTLPGLQAIENAKTL
jgi:phosphoglycerate kinase